MPAQAPMPPPTQAQAPFVLSGQAPAGPLFPQPPQSQAASTATVANDVDAAPKTARSRPKKVEPPQTQPMPPVQPAAAQGIQAPADGLPGGITDRLASLFPKSQA